ncbi:hypothetical protein GCM10017707_23350 [Paenarthrobacter aurescens]
MGAAAARVTGAKVTGAKVTGAKVTEQHQQQQDPSDTSEGSCVSWPLLMNMTLPGSDPARWPKAAGRMALSDHVQNPCGQHPAPSFRRTGRCLLTPVLGVAGLGGVFMFFGVCGGGCVGVFGLGRCGVGG